MVGEPDMASSVFFYSRSLESGTLQPVQIDYLRFFAVFFNEIDVVVSGVLLCERQMFRFKTVF